MCFDSFLRRKGLRKVRGLLYGPPPMRRLLAFFLLLWTQFNVCLSSAVDGGGAWATPPRVLPVSSPLCESALVPCVLGEVARETHGGGRLCTALPGGGGRALRTTTRLFETGGVS